MLYLHLDDPLVLRDLGTSFLWLGRVVVDVLDELGLKVMMVETRQERSEIGGLICFGGLGFGEVLMEGAKVLGLAQRRSRGQACFQFSLLWNEQQSGLAQYLKTPPRPLERLRVAGLASRIAISRQDLQERIVRAISTL
jgi:lipoate-protein ligase A